MPISTQMIDVETFFANPSEKVRFYVSVSAFEFRAHRSLGCVTKVRAPLHIQYHDTSEGPGWL